MITDDAYLIRAKQAGISNEILAAKLNTTPERIEERWQDLLKIGDSLEGNGYMNLSEKFTVLLHQYQLLGESLKPICQALGDVASLNEIIEVHDPNPRKTAVRLIQNFIILRPYIFQDPTEEADEKSEG